MAWTPWSGSSNDRIFLSLSYDKLDSVSNNQERNNQKGGERARLTPIGLLILCFLPIALGGCGPVRSKGASLLEWWLNQGNSTYYSRKARQAEREEIPEWQEKLHWRNAARACVGAVRYRECLETKYEKEKYGPSYLWRNKKPTWEKPKKKTIKSWELDSKDRLNWYTAKKRCANANNYDDCLAVELKALRYGFKAQPGQENGQKSYD